MGSTSRRAARSIPSTAPVHCPDDVYPILVRGINVNLDQLEGRYFNEDLVAVMSVKVLEGMDTHFRQRWGRRNHQTCSMVWRHQ